jgi:putative acetyltransferase
MNMNIRPESIEDAGAIEAVTIAAFRDHPHSDQTEHFIIRELRRTGALKISLVAEIDGAVVGHVAVSPVTVSDGSENWYGLGPISVEPARQRRGIGSALMNAALEELRRLEAAGCVLVGDPEYYFRFGFRNTESLRYPDVPAEYFQAVAFGSALPTGDVEYHPAFWATG